MLVYSNCLHRYVFLYDRFHQIVQNLLSITYYECHIKQTKTVLTRMDVLKNSIFHYVHDVSQNQFHFKMCTFCTLQLQHRIKYWNYILEFQSSQNSTFENTRKVTISIELLVEIFKAQTLATVLASVQGHLSL